MNRSMIRRKLQDKSGASITYALLLFLVCAVVSSVVLAAGTAASGRISKSVESDQRYYSVTSAAKFMKELINGKSAVVEQKTITIDGNEPVIENKIDGSPYNPDGLSLVTEAAACYTGLKEGDSSRTITLVVDEKESLKSFIHETVDSASGRIILVISNKEVADATDSYTITVTFDPEVSVKTSSKTQNPTTPGGARTRTETTTTTMRWVLTSMG